MLSFEFLKKISYSDLKKVLSTLQLSAHFLYSNRPFGTCSRVEPTISGPKNGLDRRAEALLDPDPKNGLHVSPLVRPQISFFRTKNRRYPHATEKNDFFFTKTVTHLFFWTHFFDPGSQNFDPETKNFDPNASIDLENRSPKLTSGPQNRPRSVQEGGRHVFLTNAR